MPFARKYIKQLLDTRLDSLKTASKKLIHKAGEFLGNKIEDAVTKPSLWKNCETWKNVEEIVIPTEKK